MKILVFGDVVGSLGREAINHALPALRAEYKPELVFINIENIAHGAGISPSIAPDLRKWKADVYTTGDHAWDNSAGVSLLEDRNYPIIRPANYPDGTPGKGYYLITSGAYTVAVINLHGQVFAKNSPLNPFHYLDILLNQADIKRAHMVFLDFHAEATSEKRGIGWYADGRITAMWGTHTHVPTADAQILPKGTGYISDVGMNGAYHSIIGFDQAAPLRRFLQQTPHKLQLREVGALEIGALLLEVDPSTGKTINLAHIRKVVDDQTITTK